MLSRTGRLWLAAAAAGLSVIMAQPAVQAWTVRGDAAAWSEVVAALKKQHSVSYRGKSSVFGNPLIVEFAPPDSQHTIIQGKVPDVIPPERITVGNISWTRDHNGKWDCSDPLTLSPEQLVPLWDRKGEVTVGRIPDLVINGMPTHGYAYTSTFDPGTGSALTISTKLYVAVQTGLPLRQIAEAATSRTPSTFDYYDYGAPIIIAPPCR